MRKPAPEIKHPYVFSVSQVETFLLCPRKWAYLKIDGLEDPGNESSLLGQDVHGELEGYLEKGRPIRVGTREGKIAMAGVPHLPPPMYPGMQIEEWFKLQIGEAWFRGLKDVQIKAGWLSHRPFISDHKTTKNLAWAKTADFLTGGATGVGDIQAGTYSYDLMEELGVDEVDLQWTYMRTIGPPLAQPTVAVMNRDQACRVIVRVEEVVEEMIHTIQTNETALTVVQDFTGCDAFGGCRFRDHCKPTPQNKMRAMFSQYKEEEKMSKSAVLGKLAARKAAKEAEAKGDTTAKPKAAPAEVESTTSEVNPPEKADAPEVTEEQVLAAGKGRARGGKGKAPVVGTPAGTTSGGVLGRAIDAFVDVLLDEIAQRVAARLK